MSDEQSETGNQGELGPLVYIDEAPPAKLPKNNVPGSAISGATVSSYPYSLLEIKIDDRSVDDFSVDASVTYDLIGFVYIGAENKYVDVKTVSVTLGARPSNQSTNGYQITIKASSNLDLVVTEREASFTQLHAILCAVKIPIPCNEYSGLAKFFRELCKFRRYSGCKLDDWKMEGFELEVPRGLKGELMYNVTLKFVLRNAPYTPGPRSVESNILIDLGQLKSGIDASNKAVTTGRSIAK